MGFLRPCEIWKKPRFFCFKGGTKCSRWVWLSVGNVNLTWTECVRRKSGIGAWPALGIPFPFSGHHHPLSDPLQTAGCTHHPRMLHTRTTDHRLLKQNKKWFVKAKHVITRQNDGIFKSEVPTHQPSCKQTIPFSQSRTTPHAGTKVNIIEVCRGCSPAPDK